jgi:hypothetical protein
MGTPVDKKTNVIPEENAVSSETGFGGPHPRPRDKSPEHQYKPSPGDNNNRTDAAAPGGPVNIPVKGGAPEAKPDQAARETPKATGGGSRDAPSPPRE